MLPPIADRSPYISHSWEKANPSQRRPKCVPEATTAGVTELHLPTSAVPDVEYSWVPVGLTTLSLSPHGYHASLYSNHTPLLFKSTKTQRQVPYEYYLKYLKRTLNGSGHGGTCF